MMQMMFGYGNYKNMMNMMQQTMSAQYPASAVQLALQRAQVLSMNPMNSMMPFMPGAVPGMIEDIQASALTDESFVAGFKAGKAEIASLVAASQAAEKSSFLLNRYNLSAQVILPGLEIQAGAGIQSVPPAPALPGLPVAGEDVEAAPVAKKRKIARQRS